MERSSLMLYVHIGERVLAAIFIHFEVSRGEKRTKTLIPLLLCSHRVCIENATSRFPSETAVRWTAFHMEITCAWLTSLLYGQRTFTSDGVQ